MLYHIISQSLERETLLDCSQSATTVVLNQHIIIHHSYPMSVFTDVVGTHMHFVTILPKPFYLIVNLLADTAMFRETVIYEEKYFHVIGCIYVWQ